MSREIDIVIVGGGLAGACMANLLIRDRQFAPDRISIVEPRLATIASASSVSASPADVDLRVSAISRASERILAASGVWQRLRAGRISPYERMCVWDEGGGAHTEGAVRFDCAQLNQPNLGYIIENSAMQAALLEQARQAGVRMIVGQIAQLTQREGFMSLGLRDGPTLEAGLVIAADGADSATRQLMGVRTRGGSYEQRAIVTHIRTSDSHRRTAWQRFLSTGPIALLPLSDERRTSIVWSTTESAAQLLMSQSDAEFCHAVQVASDGVLGRVEGCVKRVDFPLRSVHAERYVAPRSVLIGDAAHAIHPLAGQGVNMGFLDCAALAQVLSEALAHGRDPGELKVLRQYERWRKGENLLMLGALAGLNRLFSNDSPTLGSVRRAGLGFVDRSRWLKSGFMRRALGIAGDLPRIAATDPA